MTEVLAVIQLPASAQENDQIRLKIDANVKWPAYSDPTDHRTDKILTCSNICVN